MSNDPKRPVVLVVLDGWGIGRDEPGNAILAAHTPVVDDLAARYPASTLLTSGRAVGLPDEQMGNSEVGHMNLGAGFIVYQWLTRIDADLDSGELAANPTLASLIDGCRDAGTTLHLAGLVSDGGVHSHTRHLIGLLEIARARGLLNVSIHAFIDGRDSSPTGALANLHDLETFMAEIGVGRVVTVSGRYYAMDRDHRWERTRLAYDALVDGVGPTSLSSADLLSQSYELGTTDEFVLPTVIGEPQPLRPGDALLMFNFRSDRGRQLTEAISDPAFVAFPRRRDMSGLCRIATLTEYDKTLPVTVILPPHDVVHPLARALSEQGATQFHCAETEKYPHVTFFLNGGREDPFSGESRRMAPSPKVATYDLQPEMSAAEVAALTIAAVTSLDYDFVIVNFANCDMVGHTGDFAATVTAVETVDRELGRVVAATLAVGGTLIVTADHGNAEEMIDRLSGGPMTAHTTNPVPCILVSPPDGIFRYGALPEGRVLSSLAPTILDLLGLETPPEMTSPSLVRPIRS